MSSTTTTTTIDPARAAESNTATIVAVVTIFHAIALVFISLRVYARAIVIKTFGRDDIFMVLSAVCGHPDHPRGAPIRHANHADHNRSFVH